MVDTLEGAQLQVKALGVDMKKLIPDNILEPLKKVRSFLTEGRDAARATAEAMKRTGEASSGIGANLTSASEGAATLSTKMGETATSAEEVNTATGEMGATASAQIAGVDALTEAYKQLATAATSAANAQASAGGASAYHGGPVARHFADGGVMPRGQDRIMTALSKGETVVNSRNSKRFFSELNAMNQGSQPVYREQGGPVTNVGDVNVTVNGGDTSQKSVREIAHALRREIKRGTITLR
jgi:hypothetical protein